MRRLMFYQIVLVLTIAMGWSSPGWSKIIASDNFESYAVNSYPSSNWYNMFSGVDAKISSQYGVWGSQSFRLEGNPSWSRVDAKDLSYGNRIAYQTWVYIPNATRGVIVGFFKKDGNMAPSYNAIHFNNSGRITIHDNGFSDIDLQAYSANRWYHVIVSIDFNLNKNDVYIDGIKKYSGAPRSSRSNCNSFALSTNNFSGSGTAVAYFDNVWIIDNAMVTKNYHSTISSIGAFSQYPYTPGRNGKYAEVKLEFPGGLSSPSDIVLHYSHWWSQAAGSATGKIYISTSKQITPQTSSNDWETFWVGNATNLGTYVGSFTATNTQTDATVNISSYVQSNPSNSYYIAINNEASADIGVYVLYIMANSGSQSGPYEPNNTMSQAYGPLSKNVWYTAYLETSTDIDWYYVDVSGSLSGALNALPDNELPSELIAKLNESSDNKENSALVANETSAGEARLELSPTSTYTLTVDLDVPSNFDYELEVYNSSGNALGSSYNNAGIDEQVIVSVAAGRYYLKVYGYQGEYSTSSSYRVKANWVYNTSDINLTCYTGASYNYFTPTSVSPGGSFTNYFRVMNTGTQSSGTFKVFVYLSTNDVISSYDTKVGESTVSSISGGAYRDVVTSCSVPSSMTAGDYYVGMIIDPDNAVQETDENDNNWHHGSTRLLTVTSPTHTVSTPTTPTGPSTGTVGQSLSFSTGGSSCNQGHSVQYRFDWGNGVYSSWGSSSQSYSYSSAGTYTVKAQARCSSDNSVVSSWSSGKSVTINPASHTVSTPNTPSGPSTGTVNQSLSFSTGGSSCNQGHSVQYRFDWGNSVYSSWGSSSQSYSYSSAGTYTVKAQARCSSDNSVVSSWSSGKSVTIAPAGGDIPITPSTATMQPAGAEFNVDIIVGSASKPVTNLFGVSFELGYSTTYLDYVSYDKSSSFLGSDLLEFVNPDDPNGKVAIGLTRRGTTTGVSGYGSVIKIKFKSLQTTPVNTQISFAIHNATANDPNGNAIGLTPGSLTITITSGGITVWPGDTNNDRIVNQADVLPLGVYWNKTGPRRTCHANETQWIAHTATPWTPEAATYADANGDGVVNQADVLVIGLNWGKTHTMVKPFDENEDEPSGVIAGTLIPKLTYNADRKEICLDIHAEGVSDLFGLAFEVNYPQQDLSFALAEPGDLFSQDHLFFQKDQSGLGKLGIGISQKLGQATAAEKGLVIRITFRLSTGERSPEHISLKIDDVQANDDQGKPIIIQAQACSNPEWSDIAAAPMNQYQLFTNYPNPFNPTTTISYALPNAAQVRIHVFDLTGRLVKTLVDSEQQPGLHSIAWDARDEAGKEVANGMYICRMIAGGEVLHQKMILAK